MLVKSCVLLPQGVSGWGFKDHERKCQQSQKLTPYYHSTDRVDGVVRNAEKSEGEWHYPCKQTRLSLAFTLNLLHLLV